LLRNYSLRAGFCCLETRFPEQEAIVKCVICRLGETHAGKIVATLQRGETTVILKNVPAEVCDNCGEYYLSEGIADSLLKRAEVAAQQGSEVEILQFAA